MRPNEKKPSDRVTRDCNSWLLVVVSYAFHKCPWHARKLSPLHQLWTCITILCLAQWGTKTYWSYTHTPTNTPLCPSCQGKVLAHPLLVGGGGRGHRALQCWPHCWEWHWCAAIQCAHWTTPEPQLWFFVWPSVFNLHFISCSSTALTALIRYQLLPS